MKKLFSSQEVQTSINPLRNLIVVDVSFKNVDVIPLYR